GGRRYRGGVTSGTPRHVAEATLRWRSRDGPGGLTRRNRRSAPGDVPHAVVPVREGDDLSGVDRPEVGEGDDGGGEDEPDGQPTGHQRSRGARAEASTVGSRGCGCSCSSPQQGQAVGEREDDEGDHDDGVEGEDGPFLV